MPNARELVSVARPRQWTKNVVCLAPLIFSGFLVYPDAVLKGVSGFIGFCLASSAVYIFNDLRDREQDRAHPLKRTRPLASGRLTPRAALVETALLAGASFAPSFWLGLRFRWVLASFLVLHLFYSLALKTLPVLDVMAIALGFVFRVQAGIEAIRCPQSAWINLCMFFMALLLAFGKRRGELTSLHGDALRDHRPALAAYSVPYLDILIGVSAATALVCYSLYSVTVQTNETFLITILPVAFGIARYMMLVIVRTGGEEPDEILLQDLPLVTTVLIWTALCVIILYFDLGLFPRAT